MIGSLSFTGLSASFLTDQSDNFGFCYGFTKIELQTTLILLSDEYDSEKTRFVVNFLSQSIFTCFFYFELVIGFFQIYP